MGKNLSFVVVLAVAFGCSSGGPPISAPGSRIDQQIEFSVNRGYVANSSPSGAVPAISYISTHQIRNKGGTGTYRVTITPIGAGGELYEDIEGRTSPITMLQLGTESLSHRVRDFNVVRPRAIRYRLRLDVTFAEGSTGTVEGENILIDDSRPLPPGFVISEVRLVGAAVTADQFVELHNGSVAPVDVSRMTLETWSPSGGIRVAVRFPSVTVAPGCHFLMTPSARSATAEGVEGDGVLLIQLPLDGGIALRDSGGGVIDQVGFNPASVFKEGQALAPLTELRNRSHARVADSGNNASDFVVRDPSQPENIRNCGR